MRRCPCQCTVGCDMPYKYYPPTPIVEGGSIAHVRDEERRVWGSMCGKNRMPHVSLSPKRRRAPKRRRGDGRRSDDEAKEYAASVKVPLLYALLSPRQERDVHFHTRALASGVSTDLPQSLSSLLPSIRFLALPECASKAYTLLPTFLQHFFSGPKSPEECEWEQSRRNRSPGPEDEG